MKHLILILLLCGVSSLRAAECGEACSAWQECNALCPFCDTGKTGVCLDCCAFGNEAACTTEYGCYWSSSQSECQNAIEYKCGSNVPEVPPSARPWLIASLILMMLWYSLRKMASGKPR